MSLIAIESGLTLTTLPVNLPVVHLGLRDGQIAKLRRVRYSLDSLLAAKIVNVALSWTGNLVRLTAPLDLAVELTNARGIFLMGEHRDGDRVRGRQADGDTRDRHRACPGSILRHPL